MYRNTTVCVPAFGCHGSGIHAPNGTLKLSFLKSSLYPFQREHNLFYSPISRPLLGIWSPTNCQIYLSGGGNFKHSKWPPCHHLRKCKHRFLDSAGNFLSENIYIYKSPWNSNETSDHDIVNLTIHVLFVFINGYGKYNYNTQYTMPWSLWC